MPRTTTTTKGTRYRTRTTRLTIAGILTHEREDDTSNLGRWRAILTIRYWVFPFRRRTIYSAGIPRKD